MSEIDREHAARELTEEAWAGFLLWAIGQPEMREAFTVATGFSLDSPRNAIAALIDEATGFQSAVMFAFAKWATVEHWGLEYAPEAFRRACEARE